MNFGHSLSADKTWKEAKKTHVLFSLCPHLLDVLELFPSPIRARP